MEEEEVEEEEDEEDEEEVEEEEIQNTVLRGGGRECQKESEGAQGLSEADSVSKNLFV